MLQRGECSLSLLAVKTLELRRCEEKNVKLAGMGALIGESTGRNLSIVQCRVMCVENVKICEFHISSAMPPHYEYFHLNIRARLVAISARRQSKEKEEEGECG